MKRTTTKRSGSSADKPYPSVRGYFAWHLNKLMEKNPDLVLVTGDLGYGMFDKIKDKYDGVQFFNVGASEQVMLDIAVGLALKGKTPVVYSITPFLVYRGYETLVQYIYKETLPVKLIGSGIGNDYKEDGPSHWFYGYEQIPIPIMRYEWVDEIKKLSQIRPILEDEIPYLILLKR